MKYPQEYEIFSIIILDDLHEKEFNNEKIQALFKRGRHNNLIIYLYSLSVRITTSFPRERLELMEMSITSLNLITC